MRRVAELEIAPPEPRARRAENQVHDHRDEGDRCEPGVLRPERRSAALAASQPERRDVEQQDQGCERQRGVDPRRESGSAGRHAELVADAPPAVKSYR